MNAVAILLIASSLTAQSPKLESFNSTEGRFSVKLPGKTKEVKTSVKTQAGEIAIHNFIVEIGENAYAVVYSDYPDSIAQADPQKILDGARDGMVGNLQGTLLKSKNVTLDKVPGRDFEYELPAPMGKKLVGRCRTYLDRNRLYQVLVVATPDVARAKLATETLDSFKITK